MLFACAGSCLTLLLPTENRDYGFALAIPFGFAQFIIAHSALSYFTATRNFAAVLALTLAPASLLIFVFTHRKKCGRLFSEVFGAICAAIPPLLLSGWPRFFTDTVGAQNPAPSADLLSFASTAAWLRDNSYQSMFTDVPRSIGWTWLERHAQYSFPVGDAFVSNALHFVTGNSLESAQLATTLACGLVGIALYTFFRFAQFGTLETVIASIIGSCSIAVIESAHSNSLASLFGISCFITWMTLANQFLKNTLQFKILSAQTALLAMATATVTVVYPQYLILIVPGTALWVMFNRRFLLPVLSFLSLACAVAPFGFMIGIRFFTTTGASADANGFSSPFSTDGVIMRLARSTSYAPVLIDWAPNLFVGVLFFVIAILTVTSVIKHYGGRFSTLSSILSVGLLGIIATELLVDAPYTQFRLIKMMFPMIWIAVVATLLTFRLRIISVSVAALTVLSIFGFYAVNNQYFENLSLTERSIDTDYHQIEKWLAEHRLLDEEVVFLSDDYLTSQFALFSMRSLGNVKAPNLITGYLNNSPQNPWSATPARYLLVDSNLSGEVDASCIMKRNKRFMLIDTTKGSFNLVARSNGVDPFLGSHPLLQFHYPIIEIGEFSNFFVMSNDSEVSIDISTWGNQQSTRVGWSVADNAYGEYFYTSVEIRPSRSIKVPINPEKGWANFTLRRINPSYSPAFLLLDGPLKVRISKP
jgi:hypothetical protein